jgi:hypothetical protein
MTTRAGQRNAPTKDETPVQDAEGWGGGHDEEATAKSGAQGSRPGTRQPSLSPTRQGGGVEWELCALIVFQRGA